MPLPEIPFPFFLCVQRTFQVFIESQTKRYSEPPLHTCLTWSKRIGLKSDRVVKFTNKGSGPTYLGLAAPFPGKVIPVHLLASGTLLVKPSMFLASEITNSVTTAKIKPDPEGPFPQHNIEIRRLGGTGMCYIQAGERSVGCSHVQA